MEVKTVDRELTENDKKKLFLKSYLRDKQAVIRIEEQLAELRLSKLSPSVSMRDGMPHGSNMTDLSDYAAKVDELERELMRKRYNRIQSFQKVQASIEELEDETEKSLLTYRYLIGMQWETIAVKMEYSWRTIHYIHSRALEHLKICA